MQGSNTSPTFVGGTTALTVNRNAGATDIKALLHVSDTDSSQTETWTQSVAPNHSGTLSISGATAASGSADITPGGTITYQPANGYSGTETFTIQVSDGTATATRQITVTIIPPPAATTNAASGISATGATLNGTVNDNGASTTVTFDYGFTTGYGSNVAATTGGTVTAGSGNTGVAKSLAGLACNTTYHFRVKAVNSAGTTNGSDQTFTTSACPQTIIFTNPGARNFGTTPTLSATASSGLTPTFSSGTTGVCTITAGGTLTFVATGTCTIYADQAGDGTYAASPQVSQSFAVNAVAPTVTTQAASAVAATSATLGGNVTADGGTAVTARGVVYSSTDATPTIGEAGVTQDANGSGAGTFSESIASLSPGTLYYARAYATNGVGTSYGGVVNFTTHAAPTVSTQAVTTVAATSATLGGNVTADGGTAVTARGVVYSSTDATPIIGEAGVTQDANGSGSGTFSESIASLSPGTLYFVRAYATNDVGTSYGGVVSFTTHAAPTVSTQAASAISASGATLNGTINDNGANTTVTFDYGLTTGYGTNVAATTGGTVTAGTGNTAVAKSLAGLACNTTYHFRVKGVNSAGTTTGSDQTFTTSACPQTITFTNPGARNFGTTPTLSATASSGLSPTFSSGTTGVCTITGGGTLTFVTTGTCTINADQSGDGTYAAAPQVTQSFAVNAVVPGAPTIGTATAGDTQASITFTAPVFSGGASISGYTVTSNPGGLTGTGASSPVTVSGLTNGTGYTFTVTATNSAGTGSASSASNSVTPKGSQTITFTQPADQNFGTTPTLSATASSGLTPSFSSSTTGVCTITSGGALTFVTTGTCTISADQSGNGSYQAATTVSRSFAVNAVVPGAPTIGTATAGDTQASVTFSAPTFSGGASITGYTVTANPGGLTGTGASSPITVSGLTNGTGYTFTVTATNSVGTGSASAASNAITPKGSQTITFANPGAQNFGTTPTLSATASSGLTPTFSSSTTGVCTITSGGALTFVTTGTCTISADQAGNGAYQAALQVSHSFTVNKANQAISFGSAPSIVVGGTGAVSATGGASTSPITFSSTTTSVCTISGSTVTGVTAGTCTIAANQAADGNYNAAPQVTQNITIGKGGQALTFGSAPSVIVGGTGVVSATGGPSTSQVTFSSTTTSVCTVSGTTVTGVTAGTCTIAANQAADGNYNAAAQVTQNITIGKAGQTIAFGAAPSVLVGGTGVVSATGGPSTSPVTFSSTTLSVCTISGSTVTGVTAGTCTIAANQAADANYNAATQVTQNITIGKAGQTIAFGAAPSVLVGGTGVVSATGGASTSQVTFSSTTTPVCTISGSMVTGVTAGTCTIAANQAADANYNAAAQVTQNITIGKAGQTIAFGAAPSVLVGGTGVVSATGGASTSQVTFSSTTTPVCTISGSTVTGVTAGTCTIAANQAADTNYNAATQVTQNITIGKAGQTIAFGAAPSVLVGGTGVVTATGGASTSQVTFSSTTTPVCTISGSTVTGVTAGTCTIAANQPADTNYNAATQVTQNITIGKGAGDITITPASLSATYDGSPKAAAATTSPPGLTVTYTYDGSATPPTNIGSYTVVATVNDSNYQGTTSGTMIISYGSTGPSITLSTLADGTVTSVPTINISGIVTASNGLKSLTISGAPVTVNNDGDFSIPVTLKHGSNAIAVIAIDNAELETTVSRTITLDAAAPLISPDYGQTDNSVINTPQTTVSGTVDSAGTTVTISVNDSEPQPAVMNGSGFSLPVDLAPGLNTIITTATDASGKSASIKQSVTRSNDLALAVTTPSHDLKSGSPDLTISGTVIGTPPLTITVAMDGQSFTPTVTGGAFSQALTLAAEKSYPITVTATDGSGNSASITRTVIYAWLGNSEGGETATVVDTLRAFRIFLQHEQSTDTDLLRCDVAPLDSGGKPQGNGVIDLGDVILLLRSSIGLLSW